MPHISCLLSKQISSHFLSVCSELIQQVCQVMGVTVNLLSIYISVYFKSIKWDHSFLNKQKIVENELYLKLPFWFLRWSFTMQPWTRNAIVSPCCAHLTKGVYFLFLPFAEGPTAPSMLTESSPACLRRAAGATNQQNNRSGISSTMRNTISLSSWSKETAPTKRSGSSGTPWSPA